MGNKEVSTRKILDVLSEMEEITLPMRHTAESIIKTIQIKVDDGKIEPENIEGEAKMLTKHVYERIEKYVLSILKIIQDYDETEEFLHKEYDVAFGLTIRKNRLKEEAELDKR